jgi:hypothetical protein
VKVFCNFWLHSVDSFESLFVNKDIISLIFQHPLNSRCLWRLSSFFLAVPCPGSRTQWNPVERNTELLKRIAAQIIFTVFNPWKAESKLPYDWRSVGQSLLVSSPHLGPKTRLLSMSDSWEFIDIGRRLWREDWSVVYNSCWYSPAQSFSGVSPAGLVTILYCFRFETPPTWRARSPYLWNRVARLYPQELRSLFAAFYDWQGYGGGILTPFHKVL